MGSRSPWVLGLAASLALTGAVLAGAVLAQPAAPSSAYDAVDPFIGTGPDGHTFPGATVPFGMVQLSPDTEIKPFKQSYKWAAGYRHEDQTIIGFSHTHFSGTGHSDLGDVLIQPIAGAVRLEPGDSDKPGSGYRSRFSHEGEIAQPGYYAVTLSDYAVRAELTATTRVGLHRYSFPEGQPAHVLLDLRSSIYNYEGKVLWSRVRLRPDGIITGFRETRGWAPGRQLYFAMAFSQPLSGHQFHERAAPNPYHGFKGPGTGPGELDSIEGRGLVGVFDFAPLTGPLMVKVAISPVSEDGAIANLKAEAPNWDFDGARAAAKAAWEQALAKVQISAAAPLRRSLYTALYHSLLAPSVSMDVDGGYRGPDSQVHKADGFTFVSTLSLWDTYRAEQPLMTLIQPEQRTADVVNSLLASRRESPFGILPVWQFQGQETWCMIGYHALPEIADAVMKGIKGFDQAEALDAMVASATYGPYGDLADYMKLGYVPIDKEPEAASKTLEYAFDDWTLSQVAQKLGRADIAATFAARSANWRNVFEPKTGFMRARKSDGGFREPFDPTSIKYGSDYTEGNAWQWSFYAPQDTAGLIKAGGGERKFVAKLDAMFDFDDSKLDYSSAEDIAGLIGQYIHGNEPSHHVAYLYDYAGQPWRTQERLKQIVDSQYKPAPDGLVGNDDLGQMSAWLVFTALGFYPVAPGSNQYVIGRPFVDRAVMTLPNDRTFTVIADQLSDANRYVGAVTLNGKPLPRSYIRHDEIMPGGELRFVMRATPNKAWATGKDQRPFSMSTSGASAR